ncbi:N-acetylmuramic acid 6-phosphate etherase [Pelagibacterium lentulum]|uniref:N-acetylmuramic acid 6-phosphate etherase n=1 Tax=Pelagibacterium lentulum TaxID=2029865 RepID=A0A916R619_9HYPH|nr:N-acetylmuramic acid 6-phosphate etherase [Pelagibacterium lentulum]GGA36639.1 N-acetylmuramic acid 6-phosphate etherase [Pelagibacterium lentulum]
MIKTEIAAARFADLESWSGSELIEGIIEGQFAAIAAVHAVRPLLSEAVEKATQRLEAGGRLIYLGAGTSGRIATQDAAELPPTFNWPYARAISLMAGGNGAFIEAVEGAEDSETAAPQALDHHGVGPNDVVIGLAASGRTPFTIAGLAHARKKGALTIGIHNNPGGQVGAVSEIDILLDTGAEILAGSTRMKAGTAQKAALNCISTGVMIALGYVYKGLMVEMRPTNEKLRIRAAEIVAAITGAKPEVAQTVLVQTDYSIKLAAIMIVQGLDLAAAESVLAQAGGNLRIAMDGRA